MTDATGMDHRVSALETAVESLARSAERTTAQLDELIRIGERQVAQKDALERAFNQIGQQAARADEHRLKIQAVEGAQHRTEEDLRLQAQKASTIDERLVAVERKLPGLEEVRRWVIVGVLAIVAAAAALVWDSVTEARARAPAASAGLVEREGSR